MSRTRNRPHRPVKSTASRPAEPSPPTISPRGTNAVLIAGTVVVASILGGEIYFTGSQSGLPRDAAFLTARIADNLVHGDGFGVNPGEPFAAISSPLFVLLFSLLRLFGLNAVAAAKIVAAFSFLLAGLAAARLAYRLVRRTDVAVLTGLATLLAGSLVWAGGSGTAIATFVAAALFALEAALASWAGPAAPTRARRIGLGLLFALAALADPAGFVLFGLWLASEAAPGGDRPAQMPSLWTLGAFAVLTAPWIAFSMATVGAPFGAGSTEAAGSAGTRLVGHLLELLLANPLLALFFPVGLLLAARVAGRERPSRLVAGAALALPATGAIAGGEGAFTTAVPLELLLGAVGLAFAAGKARASPELLRPLVRITFVVVIAAGSYGAFRAVERLAEEVTHVNKLYARLGAWARAKVPADAVIATTHPGAIAYLGERRVLDLGAAVRTLGVPPAHDGENDVALFRLLARERPAYLAVDPERHPHLTARPDLFEPAAILRNESPRAGEGAFFAAYRARWEELTPGPPFVLSDAEGRLAAVRAAVREGRAEEAESKLVELEARGPLHRDWRRKLYVARAETALARNDCRAARKSLVQLDWLQPPAAFRKRESIDELERRAMACKG